VTFGSKGKRRNNYRNLANQQSAEILAAKEQAAELREALRQFFDNELHCLTLTENKLVMRHKLQNRVPPPSIENDFCGLNLQIQREPFSSI